MATTMEVLARLTADVSDLKRGMADAERYVKNLESETNGSTSRMGSMFSSLAHVGVTAFAAIGAGATAMAGWGLKVAMETETAQVGFETLLGSAKEADAFLQELQQFAATTPFEFPDLRTAASRLLAVGVEADSVIPLMTRLGDATAAMGTGSEGINRAVTALQQMSTAGKITGQDMMQLASAGIPAWDALAAQVGMSVADVKEAVSGGEIALEDLFLALENGAGESMQRVSGMMEVQSQTLSGLLSTLKDNVQMALGDMMGPAVESIKGALPQVTETISKALEAIGPQVSVLATGIIDLVSGLLPVVAPLIGSVAGLMGSMFTALKPVIEGLVPIVEALAPVFAQVSVAFEYLGEAANNVMAVLGEAFIGVMEALTPLIEPLARVIAVFAAAFSDALLPILEAIMPVLVDFGTMLGDTIMEAMDLLTPVLRMMVDEFRGMGPELDRLASAFMEVFKALLPVIPNLAQLAVDLAPAFMEILKALTPVVTVLAEVLADALAWAVGLLGDNMDLIAPVALTLVGVFKTYNAVMSTMKGITALVTKGQALFNMVMGANPILIVVAAIAALIAALVAAYFKFEGFRKVVDSVWQFLQTAWDWITKVFVGVWHAVVAAWQAAWDVIKSVVTVAWDAITAYVKVYIAIIKAIVETIVTVFRVVWDTIVAILRPIMAVIGAIIETAVNIIKGYWMVIQNVWDTVWNAIKAAFEVVWNLITGMIETGINIIRGYLMVLNTIWQEAWEVIKAVFEPIWAAIQAVFQTGVDIMGTAIGVMVSVFQTVWNAVKAVFDPIWNGIKTAVETGVNVIRTTVETLKGVFSTVFNAVKSVVEPIINGLTGLFTRVFDGLKKIVEAIRGPIETVFNGIRDVASTIFDGLSGAFKAVVNTMLGGIETAINFAIRILNVALDGIDKAAGPLVNFDSIPEVRIGRLAKGGLVQAPMLSWIGEAGQEAVLPLTSPTAMTRIGEAVAKAMPSPVAPAATTTRGGFAPTVNIAISTTNSDPREIEEAVRSGIDTAFRQLTRELAVI